MTKHIISLLILSLLGLFGIAHAQTYPIAAVAISGTQTGAASGAMTIAFNQYSVSVPYGPWSTSSSIASAFAANFSADPQAEANPRLCTNGVCAKSSANIINFQLSGNAQFGPFSITCSGTCPFSAQLAKIPTQITVSLQPQTITQGSSFNAVVSLSTNTSARPTGSVTCSVAGISQSGTLSSGVATITFTNVPVGAQTVSCSYPGTSLYAPSLAPATAIEQVNSPLIGVNIAASNSPSTTTYGDIIQFGATVSPISGSSPPSAPTGTITFYANGNPFGAAIRLTLGSTTSTVMITSAVLPLGTYNITAVYSGDSQFQSGTSAPVTQIVGQAGPCAH